MKKILVLFILFIFIFTLFCDTSYAYTPLDKLSRGIRNLLISPLEFFQAVTDAFNNNDIALAWPMGLFWGGVNTVKRAGVGFFEIVTFIAPFPPDYGPLIEEPIFLSSKEIKEKEEVYKKRTEEIKRQKEVNRQQLEQLQNTPRQPAQELSPPAPK